MLTLWFSPKGLPMAMAGSPSSRSALLPSGAAADFFSACIPRTGRAPRRAGAGGERKSEESGEHRECPSRARLPGRAQPVDGGELGLDAAGLLGLVLERLEVARVFLLVEQAALDVALDHAAVEIANRDFLVLLRHVVLLGDRARASSTSLLYGTAPMPPLPHGAYAIADGSAGKPVLDLVGAFVRGGAAVVQLRMKASGLGPREWGLGPGASGSGGVLARPA